MEEKKSGDRKVALYICCALILACFVAHYMLKGSCVGADAVHDYFIMTFIPQLGNAGILFVLLWWFGTPMIAKMVADRKANIERDIDESAKKKEAAQAAYELVMEKQKALPAEKKQMRQNFINSANEECARIEAETEHTANRLRKDAEVSFELQSNAAQNLFEDEVMGKAIEQARKEIMQRLASDSSLRNRLIDQSIASIEL